MIDYEVTRTTTRTCPAPWPDADAVPLVVAATERADRALIVGPRHPAGRPR